MGAWHSIGCVVTADAERLPKGALVTALKTREGLCNTLFVLTADSGYLGAHIVQAELADHRAMPWYYAFLCLQKSVGPLH